VGLSQPVANPDLVVSPVPARNGQMIRVESLREPIRRVEILQACGRCEYVQDVAPAATDMLPAQGLTPGIYFLRIVTANHRISFNKILLQ
jgi:hypothetical protein